MNSNFNCLEKAVYHGIVIAQKLGNFVLDRCNPISPPEQPWGDASPHQSASMQIFTIKDYEEIE